MTEYPPVHLCRLEQFGANGWTVRHAGIALLHPHRYAERLMDRDWMARCTVIETGEVFAVACRHCGSTEGHIPGTCLL